MNSPHDFVDYILQNYVDMDTPIYIQLEDSEQDIRYYPWIRVATLASFYVSELVGDDRGLVIATSLARAPNLNIQDPLDNIFWQQTDYMISTENHYDANTWQFTLHNQLVLDIYDARYRPFFYSEDHNLWWVAFSLRTLHALETGNIAPNILDRMLQNWRIRVSIYASYNYVQSQVSAYFQPLLRQISQIMQRELGLTLHDYLDSQHILDLQ